MVYFQQSLFGENVMGAFSSNNRMDFRAVLSAFTDTDVSMPASGRWAGAGMVRGRTPDLCWRLMDAQHWASPPAGTTAAHLSCGRLWRTAFPRNTFLSPAQCSHFLHLAEIAGCPPPAEIEALLLKQGGAYQLPDPFNASVCGPPPRSGRKQRSETASDCQLTLFPTLLAGGISPFAFWYEDDPAGGCIRFPTETECERLMGLPEGWTKYGADGEEILSSHRYRALGNAIALPCAEYIMAGIAEALTKGGANDGI